MQKNRTEIFQLFLIFLGGIVLLFILAPLVSMFINTTPLQFSETAKDSEVRDSIWLTLWTSFAATFIFSVFAIPLSYILARKSFPLKSFVDGLINLPIVIPHSAAGIAVLGILAKDTILGGIAKKFGFGFVSAPAGIIIAMAFVSVPFLINSARDAFANVPERLEKVAMNLGASPARVFFTISLPLAMRGILSGLVMMWARGMSEFGAVVIIAYHPMITPVLIWERFGSYGLKYARPVAALFVIICLIIFIALRILAKRKNYVETR